MSSKKANKPNASLRTLILMLNLVNARFGLTQAKLLEIVPGYPRDPVNGQRMFERDVEGLREAGFTVEVLKGAPPRYRIARNSFTDASLNFTDEQVSLVLKGAAAWAKQSGTPTHSIANKVRGYANLPIETREPNTSYNLETGVDLQTLLTAIEDDQPIRFDYASRKAVQTREVAPLSLVARRQVLYLWGFDLNRWDERLFRLSRFRSKVQPVAEGGAVVASEHLPDSFDESRFLIQPVLAVNKQKAPETWFASFPISEEEAESLATALPRDFELRRGRRDDIAFWETLVLREATGAVPLAPRHLVAMTRQMLDRAANLEAYSDA